MTLSVEQRAVDNDVRYESGDDVPKHALEVMKSSNFLAVTFLNSREPGEAAKAASPTKSARSLLWGFPQLPYRQSLKDSMLGVLVLKFALWNLYARATATLPVHQGAPPMPSAQDLQRELVSVLSSYFTGETSMSEYLTWEVEFTTSDDARVDLDLAGNAAGLALLGHEHLMDLRPLADFDREARRLLNELQPTGSTSEAAGS